MDGAGDVPGMAEIANGAADQLTGRMQPAVQHAAVAVDQHRHAITSGERAARWTIDRQPLEKELAGQAAVCRRSKAWNGRDRVQPNESSAKRRPKLPT